MAGDIYDPMGFVYEGFSSSKKKSKPAKVDDTPFMADPKDALKMTSDLMQGLMAVHLGLYVASQVGRLAKQ